MDQVLNDGKIGKFPQDQVKLTCLVGTGRMFNCRMDSAAPMRGDRYNIPSSRLSNSFSLRNLQLSEFVLYFCTLLLVYILNLDHFIQPFPFHQFHMPSLIPPSSLLHSSFIPPSFLFHPSFGSPGLFSQGSGS